RRGEGDPRVPRDALPILPQHPRLPRRGPDPLPGPGRGRAPLPRLGIDPRGEGAARPLAPPGPASRNTEAGRRRRGDRTDPRDVPLAPRPHPADAARPDRVAVDPPHRPRRTRRTREQEAPPGRTPRHTARTRTPQNGTRPRPLARWRPRSDPPTRRGLRELPLPPTAPVTRGPRRSNREWVRAPDLGARLLRLRRELRRSGEAVPRAAGWTTRRRHPREPRPPHPTGSGEGADGGRGAGSCGARRGRCTRVGHLTGHDPESPRRDGRGADAARPLPRDAGSRAAAETLPRHRPARPDPRRPRREPDSGRGHLTPRRAGWRQGDRHPRYRGRGTGRGAGQRRPDRDGE